MHKSQNGQTHFKNLENFKKSWFPLAYHSLRSLEYNPNHSFAAAIKKIVIILEHNYNISFMCINTGYSFGKLVCNAGFCNAILLTNLRFLLNVI